MSLGEFTLPFVQIKQRQVVPAEMDDAMLQIYYWHLAQFRDNVSQAIAAVMIRISCEQIARMREKRESHE